MYIVIYRLQLGYNTAVNRIRDLLSNEHYPEALVSSMFTVEKTLRRTLRQIVTSAGFASKYADKIIGNLRGLDALKKAWELYEPNNTKLSDIIPAVDWKLFKDVAEMRNKMVHGERVYELETCRKEAEKVLEALNRLKLDFDNRYGYSGWVKFSARVKSTLHADPKIKINP
jgi:hypothetical protein